MWHLSLDIFFYVTFRVQIVRQRSNSIHVFRLIDAAFVNKLRLDTEGIQWTVKFVISNHRHQGKITDNVVTHLKDKTL